MVFGWRANVMRFEIPFDLPGPRPAIAGTGLIALDVVIPNEPRSLPQLWAGGTCGNVLTALAYLGWDSYRSPVCAMTHCRVASTTTLPAGTFASIIWILTKMAALLSSCSTSIPQQPAGALTRSQEKNARFAGKDFRGTSRSALPMLLGSFPNFLPSQPFFSTGRPPEHTPWPSMRRNGGPWSYLSHPRQPT